MYSYDLPIWTMPGKKLYWWSKFYLFIDLYNVCSIRMLFLAQHVQQCKVWWSALWKSYQRHHARLRSNLQQSMIVQGHCYFSNGGSDDDEISTSLVKVPINVDITSQNTVIICFWISFSVFTVNDTSYIPVRMVITFNEPGVVTPGVHVEFPVDDVWPLGYLTSCWFLETAVNEMMRTVIAQMGEVR